MSRLDTINEYAEKYKEEMLASIAEVIAIDSTEQEPKEGMPFGEGPAAALKKALEIADTLGFNVKNLDNYAGYAEIGEGDEIIGVLGHLDVVPASDGWDTDPFKLIQKDGVLYARGVTDDKGPIIAAMYAAKIVADMDVPLSKRIRIVFGTNEETGFGCVKHYAEAEGGFDCGFTPDASFPLIFGEKGNYNACFCGKTNTPGSKIQIVSIKGGEAKNIVCGKCTAQLKTTENHDKIASKLKKYADKNTLEAESSSQGDILTLTLIGKPAHASTPELGINAASHLMKFLEEFIPESPFIKGYNNAIGLSYDGSKAGIAYFDEYGALTFNVGTLEANEYTASGTIDIRYPITTKDFKPYSDTLAETLINNDMQLDAYTIGKPLFVDPASSLVAELYRAYTEVTGDTQNKPYTIGGGTYAKAFDNIVAFGPEYPGYEHNIHTANEQMPVEYLMNAVKVYANALIALLKI